MKDAYSFHATAESLDEAYEAMRAAYRRIFEACRLDYAVVEADTGTIGGSSSHEFMVLGRHRRERGRRAARPAATAPTSRRRRRGAAGAASDDGGERGARERSRRRARRPIERSSKFLGVEPGARRQDAGLRDRQGQLVAVAIRGDREVNEVKLQNALGRPAPARSPREETRAGGDRRAGRLRRAGRPAARRCASLADESVRGSDQLRLRRQRGRRPLRRTSTGSATRRTSPSGSTSCSWSRRRSLSRAAAARCELSRGIEVGHIFKLGTKYSQAMRLRLHRRERRRPADDHGLLRPRHRPHGGRRDRAEPRRRRHHLAAAAGALRGAA